MSQQRIQGLRKQHGDLLQIAARLRQAMAAQAPAERLSALLGELAMTLAFHLGVEDGVLYPELLASSEPRIVEQARRFLKEMVSLRSAFEAYHATWPAERIAVGGERFASERFASETLAVLDALERRIRRENEELYPLLER